jgi:hypothetical protein
VAAAIPPEVVAGQQAEGGAGVVPPPKAPGEHSLLPSHLGSLHTIRQTSYSQLRGRDGLCAVILKDHASLLVTLDLCPATEQ